MLFRIFLSRKHENAYKMHFKMHFKCFLNEKPTFIFRKGKEERVTLNVAYFEKCYYVFFRLVCLVLSNGICELDLYKKMRFFWQSRYGLN